MTDSAATTLALTGRGLGQTVRKPADHFGQAAWPESIHDSVVPRRYARCHGRHLPHRLSNKIRKIKCASSSGLQHIEQ